MDNQAEQLLAIAERRFWQAAAGEAILLAAVEGLDALIKASVIADLATAFPAQAARTRDLIQRAAVAVANVVERSIPSERVHLLASSAAGLVGNYLPELKQDRQLHASLLRAELLAILCRQAISERGDPLARVISINRAMAASPAACALH